MNANVKRLFEPGQDFIALREYITTVGDGVKVGWVDIEKATGIRMNESGRAVLRRVFRKLSRHYISVPGFGIETASARNARDVHLSRVVRLKNAVDATQTTSEQLLGRFGPAMNAEDRRALEHTTATLSTLSLVKSLAAKPKG